MNRAVLLCATFVSGLVVAAGSVRAGAVQAVTVCGTKVTWEGRQRVPPKVGCNFPKCSDGTTQCHVSGDNSATSSNRICRCATPGGPTIDPLSLCGVVLLIDHTSPHQKYFVGCNQNACTTPCPVEADKIGFDQWTCGCAGG